MLVLGIITSFFFANFSTTDFDIKSVTRIEYHYQDLRGEDNEREDYKIILEQRNKYLSVLADDGSYKQKTYADGGYGIDAAKKSWSKNGLAFSDKKVKIKCDQVSKESIKCYINDELVFDGWAINCEETTGGNIEGDVNAFGMELKGGFVHFNGEMQAVKNL